MWCVFSDRQRNECDRVTVCAAERMNDRSYCVLDKESRQQPNRSIAAPSQTYHRPYFAYLRYSVTHASGAIDMVQSFVYLYIHLRGSMITFKDFLSRPSIVLNRKRRGKSPEL